MAKRKRINTEEFIRRCELLYCGEYDYTNSIFTTSHAKITVTCKIHGDFSIAAYSHLQGHGCAKCLGVIRAFKPKDYSDKQVEFLRLAVEKFSDKYSYENAKYSGSKRPISVTCKLHGEFKTTPSRFLNSPIGCPTCVAVGRRVSTEEYISRVKSVHGDLYDYSLVNYTAMHSHIKIICRVHGEFSMVAHSHLYKKSNCPSCVSAKKISISSTEWLDSLGISGLIREYRLPENKRRPVDGYDPETNTIYQFHGAYFHSDPRIYRPESYNQLLKLTHGENYIRSCKLDDEIISYGYKLVIMHEADWAIISGGRRLKFL